MSEDRRTNRTPPGARRSRHRAGVGLLRPQRERLHPQAVPSPVHDIAATLRHAGGESWVVGGAVRDLLLGRPAHDWDIATNLPPDHVRTLFPRAVEVGLRFGTVVVVQGGQHYQVTTFRKDAAYADARHPDSVEFTRKLEDDLLRRDFTVNALAYDPSADRLVDVAGGVQDLEAGLIRAVGDPRERFHEDGLRPLRAVRFVAQLGFSIERATLRALVLEAPRIGKISAERIREEMEKLLTAPAPAEAMILLLETGLLRRIWPELAACYGVPQNPHHAYDVLHHTLAALDASSPEDRVVRLAVLFHDTGKPSTRTQSEETASFYGHQFVSERLAHEALRRLRFANEERDAVGHLVRNHMFHYRPEWSDGAVRRFLREIGEKNLDALFAVRHADTLGNGRRKRIAPELDQLRDRIDREIARQSALTVRDLAIGGHDLMQALGLPPSPEIGRILRTLLEEVLDDPSRNERETLLSRARELHTTSD